MQPSRTNRNDYIPADQATLQTIQAEKLRIQQRSAWLSGRALLVEELVRSHSKSKITDDQLLELLYAEVCFREQIGKSPSLAEYVERFPGLKERLEKLFEIHQAINNEIDGEETLDSDTTKLLYGSTAGYESPASTPSESPLGDYKLLEEIARGGMGVVYKARQISLDRIVALKMIKSGEFANQEQVDRFYKEAKAAGNLDHPGIVPVYEVGDIEGQHYFTMGFVDGENLSDRLRGGPVPPKEAARYAKSIAEAVAYAHSKGVIHRDLKPGNVLITKDGQIKITDFGLAKRVEEDSELTATGQVL